MAVNRTAAVRGVERALLPGEARLERLRERREREHEALLRAARRVFVKRGYADTRIEDILRAANISTRALYRFHSGKDELFLELFDRANRAAIIRLRALVARRASAPGQVAALVDATLDLAYDRRLRGETLLFASAPGALAERYAAEVRACREQLVAVVREVIVSGRRAGDFRSADPQDDAWAIHGALGAALERVLRPGRTPSRARLSRHLRRFCRAALTG